RNIHNHRSGSSCSGTIKCCFYDPWKLLKIRHLIDMYSDPCCYSDDVRFLESIRSNDCRAYLSGQYYNLKSIHPHICNACHQFCTSGTGSGNDDARLSCNPCIAFGCMDEALFMSAQDMLERCFSTMDGIVDWKYGTPRV